MNSSIIDILEKCKDAGTPTHVSMGCARGKYSIGTENIDIFWKEYCNGIQNQSDTDYYTVAELPVMNEHTAVIVDIDFKLKRDQVENEEDNIYKQSHVEKIINIYQTVLREILEDCNDDKLMCVYLSKSPYIDEKGDTEYYKNGFHLHFPNCFLRSSEQKTILVPKVKSIMDEQMLFDDLELDKESSSFLDDVSNKPWLLYGSSKDSGYDSYEIETIYDHNVKEISLKNAFENYKVYDSNEDIIPFKKTTTSIIYHLPIILSIISNNRPVSNIKKNIISPSQLKDRKVKEERYQCEDISKTIEKLRQLLPMISVDNKSRDEWVAIGSAIKYETKDDPAGLDLFHEFSSRSEYYNSDGCTYTWESLNAKEITMGTIIHYAKQDNISKYNEYLNKRYEDNLEEYVKGTHYGIAKMLYDMYGDTFVCAEYKGKDPWYQYIGHSWRYIGSDVFLRKKISFYVVSKLRRTIKKYKELLNTCGKDKVLEVKYKELLEMTSKLINKLETTPFKNNVMNEAMELFYDDKFSSLIDKNRHIIGFKNGIYDLKSHKFRDGIPSDYVTKHMPINYRDFSNDTESISMVEDFLLKTFPDESIRKYFLDTNCDIFEGGNKRAKAYFWTGTGRNGKSITQKIMESMLGRDLAVNLTTTVLTGRKNDSGSADPQLSRVGGGVRWVAFSEPDGDEEIHSGRLKFLTGGDSIEVRDLYQTGRSMSRVDPMFIVTFICNKLPKIKALDEASCSRIRVIPFESKFCHDAPESLEEQIKQKRFPLDDTFAQKALKNLLEPFAWYLLQHYKNCPELIKEPPKVLKATNMFHKSNDIIGKYFSENLIKETGSKVSISDIYTAYRAWLKEYYPSIALDSVDFIQTYLKQNYGARGVRLSNYRFRTPNDDDYDSDEEDNYDSDECSDGED